VADSHGLNWARLGVARARLVAGDPVPARRLLETLVAEAPDYADAHDLLARVRLEQAELPEALDAFRTCVSLTPGCMLRLQHCGTLAFYSGHADESSRLLERALSMGRKSRLFDALSLALLALLRFDRADDKGLAQVQELLALFQQEHPGSRRMRRFVELGLALRSLRQRRFDDTLAQARAMASAVNEPDFDLEAAGLLLALWSRLPREEMPAGEWDSLLRAVGMRYCVSHTLTEVLVASARTALGAEAVLRSCHQVVFNVAEQALNQSMSGRPGEAVDLLLQQGEHTRNAKLIEMAGLVTQRHAAALGEAEALGRRATALKQRYCRPLTHIAGIRRSSRSPGGLAIRA
jgi:tetratricopeptide (TPR) repeat protein